MTPYFQSGGITLYHADCREVLPTLSADVLVTDPPYGRRFYASDLAPVASFLAGLIAAHCTAAIFGYPEDLAAMCARTGVEPHEWVTWWPTNKAGGRSAARLPSESEHIAIFGPTPGAKLLYRPRTGSQTCRDITVSRGLNPDQARLGDVWRDASPGMAFNFRLRNHPNEKPVSLMQRLIVLTTGKGQTVFDPYAGSGSTLLAAADLDRRAIGIEIEERYCEIAARRLETAQQQERLAA